MLSYLTQRYCSICLPTALNGKRSTDLDSDYFPPKTRCFIFPGSFEAEVLNLILKFKIGSTDNDKDSLSRFDASAYAMAAVAIIL